MDFTQVIYEVMQYTYMNEVKNALFVDKETYNNTKHIREKLENSMKSLIRFDFKNKIAREWYSKCKLKKEYEFIIIRDIISDDFDDYSEFARTVDYPSVFINKPGFEIGEEIVPNGSYQEWYPNGQLKIKTSISYYTFNEDFDSHGYFGEYEEWYSNGNLKLAYFRTQCGKYSGLYQEFYESGEIKIEKNYKNGELHGYYTQWFEDGEIDFEKKYNRGKLIYML